jgi:hypothetical protein
MIICHTRDLALSLEPRSDLAIQRLLFRLFLRRSLRLHRQEEVGTLLLELLRNGRRVWSATGYTPAYRDMLCHCGFVRSSSEDRSAQACQG